MKDTGTIVRDITLYCQKGGSDKVYCLQISEVDGGFNLIFANARRGGSLKPKIKNANGPIPLEQANRLFDQCVKEKKSRRKGYTESEDGGSTLLCSDHPEQDSGVRLQLLNSIDEKLAMTLCFDKEWVAQQKHNGERRPILVNNREVEGINRYGQYTGLVSEIKNGIDNSVQMLVDGEDLKTHVAAFDLMTYDGEDMRQWGFMDRYKKLRAIACHSPALRVSEVAVTTDEKLALIARIKQDDGEGVVFKRAHSRYIDGKPSKGGDQLKFKLYDEASVLVTKLNIQRSVGISVFDEKNLVPLGNVTIPPNAEVPELGDVIEVKYLYAYRQGSLYQPVFCRPRNDQRKEECRQSQLKYKPEQAA